MMGQRGGDDICTTRTNFPHIAPQLCRRISSLSSFLNSLEGLPSLPADLDPDRIASIALSASTKSGSDAPNSRRLSLAWNEFFRLGADSATMMERKASLALVLEETERDDTMSTCSSPGSRSPPSSLFLDLPITSVHYDWNQDLQEILAGVARSGEMSAVARANFEPAVGTTSTTARGPFPALSPPVPTAGSTDTFQSAGLAPKSPLGRPVSPRTESSPPKPLTFHSHSLASLAPQSKVRPIVGRTIHNRVKPTRAALSTATPLQKKSTAKLVAGKAPLISELTESTKKNKAGKPAGYTPRPPNAWILYRSEQIRVLKEDANSSTVKKPQSDICESPLSINCPRLTW